MKPAICLTVEDAKGWSKILLSLALKVYDVGFWQGYRYALTGLKK